MAASAGHAGLRHADTQQEALLTMATPTWNGAPFDGAMAEEVRALVARLAPAQRLWLSGYLAGTLAQGAPPLSAAAAPPRPATTPVTILYGSQSGNSENLARRLAQRLAARGATHRLLDMLDCRRADLEQAQLLLVLVSTHGDGDPPERAAPFFELLASRRAPALPRMRFAVLSLGDSSYEQFCAAGRLVDARLEELGARRLLPRAECDVDFESAASAWLDSVCATLPGPGGDAATPVAMQLAKVAPVWTRRNPFTAEVLANQALTARGSTKDVRHLELSIHGADIPYIPGDALGIVPRNAPAEVDALLAELGFAPDAPVRAGERDTDLRTALLEHCEIGTLSPALLGRYAAATRQQQLERLTGDAAALAEWSRGRDLRDLIAAYPPAQLDAPTFARLLAPLAPRLYSIASSASATPDEVHLTVGVVAHEARGRARRGVVSGAIADLAAGATLGIYLHRNEGFRLPAEPRAAVVMIGAGTGVAPYRGFLAERAATGASGRNWLLFGDRSFETDFLYQAEWLAWRRRGLLNRLDVAFSRDQAEKRYVQHRLREHGAQLWHWLQEGAHLYVCGDARRMAPDVEDALLHIAQQHGGLDEEAAREHLHQLRRARRYQKDVY